MIKKFKIFESENKYRDIDLQELWNKYNDVRIDLKRAGIIEDLDGSLDTFKKNVLNKIILNNRIDFGEPYNLTTYDKPINKELFRFGGIVTNIVVKYSNNDIHIKGYINNGLGYILAKLYISKEYNTLRKKYALAYIIRIYDTDKTEIEKQIDLFYKGKKFNL